MALSANRIGCALAMTIALFSCVSRTSPFIPSQAPVTLDLTLSSNDHLNAEYLLATPTRGLHFAQELGGYRAEAWQPSSSVFQWVTEGEGERIERRDGRPFDRVTFVIPVDYRDLPKSYAPFSPFSEGSTLIHSGQFHTCLTTPCDGTSALPIAIKAAGMVIGVEGRRTNNSENFVSDEEGTNIFVGRLTPIDADGFIAIIDPGLPTDMRQHLDRSLPQSIRFFSMIYGPLSFTPELYVSIDNEPEARGRISTQGGTLPNQIFIHFDGENAQERLAAQAPYRLDWFFAHEAAHLFQQDKIGTLAGRRCSMAA